MIYWIAYDELNTDFKLYIASNEVIWWNWSNSGTRRSCEERLGNICWGITGYTGFTCSRRVLIMENFTPGGQFSLETHPGSFGVLHSRGNNQY